ncbi:MAG: DUF6930 domain-containing protein, partial [Gemmatimonadaceae bacterium]
MQLVDGSHSSTARIFDPSLRAELSADWELEAVPFPARFSDDAAARPVAVLVGSGPIVVHVKVLSSPPAEPDELARLLAGEVAAAIAAVQRTPRRIDVRHASIAEALGPLLQQRGIAVRLVPSLTNLGEAARALSAHLAGKENVPMASAPETWAGWGLTREYIARLFRAAATYYRAQPWQLIADDRPIVATLADGSEWRAIILGNAGQEFGLALYSDPEDVEYLYSYSGADPSRALLTVRGVVLSITYQAKDVLPPRMRREIRDAGWEIAAPAAYPLLMVLGTPGGGVRQCQIEEMIALLHAVPRFVAAAQRDGGVDLLERWTDDQSGAELSFDLSRQPVPEPFWDQSDQLTPSGPVGPGARPDVRLRDEPDEVRQALAQETLDRFVQHAQSHGRFAAVSAATARKHASAGWLFLQFLTEYQGIGPSAVTEFDLRVFLYDWYPRKVMDSEQAARALCGSLRRFFSFLADVEGIECPWADSILRDRDAFLVMCSRARGLDPESAGENWLAPFTADLEYRALLPANDAEAIEWGGLMGEKEATLFDEVQRLWLIWRDEIIRGGISERDAVYAALCERLRAWANSPNELVGGQTPVRAVAQERK